MLASGCSTPCPEYEGVYPPPHIKVTGAETVEVPHIAWECPGYNSDSMELPPSVAPGTDEQLQVEVVLEAGTTAEVRFGNEHIPVDPAPREGANAWVFQVPTPSEPLIVRLCSEDDRCALYWANTYAG
jgi:hypothetical protein